MKAFVVSVNGKRVCTAGIGADGVVSVIVHWVGGGPRSHESDFRLQVGAMDSRTEEHFRWETPEIKIGDTVTINVVEANKVSPKPRRSVLPKPKPKTKSSARKIVKKKKPKHSPSEKA